MSTQSPFFFQQFRKADGTPLSNGNLYTYVTESVIPKAIFYDREETLPCPNPLPLDDSGFVPQYYLATGLYTFVLKDKDDQTVATRDNIEGVLGSGSVISLMGEYLPLSGGSLSGNLYFDFSEAGANNIKVIQNHIMSRRRSGGTYIDLYFNTTNEDYPVLEVNSTDIDSPTSLKVTEGNVSARSFVIPGGTASQYLRADGSLGSGPEGNFLPLSGGTMSTNAQVVFNNTEPVTSAVGEEPSIVINRAWNSNQNAFGAIEINNHTGFGIKITNEDDNNYSAARFTNNAEDHGQYALELDGQGKSLLVSNRSEFYGDIYSNNLGTGLVRSVNGVLTSGTSADSNLFSTGAVVLPTLNDLGTGSFTIQQGTYRLYPTEDFTGEIKQFDNVTGGYFTPTQNVESYIVVKYNSGNPVLELITDKTQINNSNVILLYTVWLQDSTIHSVGYDSLALGLGNKTESYIRNTQMYKKSIDGGLVLSEDGSRHIIVTSAVVYSSVVPQTVGEYNSSTDTLTLVSGGVYTDQTQYDNTNYNGGILTNNKFGTRWFFRSIGDAKQVFYVLGSEYNSVELAKLESIPTIPTLLRDHCVLIGRIIIQKGAASGLVENVSDVSFSTSQVQNHNDLGNIQGGSTGEYYHLTNAQYNSLTSGSYLPLSGGTLTGLLSGTSISVSGAVDAGVSRMQASKIGAGESWFGYAGKNTAGAYIGYYANSASDVRIAAGDTRSVNIGNGSNYSMLVMNNSGSVFSNSVSANAGLTCNGWLVLPLATFRQHYSDPTYQAIYGSSVVASNNNFSFGMRQDGYKTLINSTNTTTLAVNNIDQLIATSAGVSANFISINNYPVGYKLWSSAYAVSGAVGGTTRTIIPDIAIPAGVLNNRTVRVTFSYNIQNAGSHTAYISASLGGKTFNDSSMSLGTSGNLIGKYTLLLTALTSGSTGYVAVDSMVNGKQVPNTVILSQQNYYGTEFGSSWNLNNAQTLSILVSDNSGSSTIYVHMPLIEVL